MNPVRTPAPFSPAQRSLLALVLGAGVINYLDRAALSIAIVSIRAEMQLDAVQMGLVLAAFPLAYALAQLPAGALVDRFGVGRVLGAGLAFWSLAQLGGAAATGLATLFFFRLLLAVGESTALPGAQALTTRHFAPDQRGRATGVWNCVSSIGPALAPLLLTPLMLALGWRWMFAVLGGAGLLYAALWTWRFAALSRPSNDAEPAAQAPSAPPWRSLLASRTTWCLMLGYFGLVYMHWLWQTWLPAYLEMALHVKARATGPLVAIPFAFGIAGSLVAGWLSDRLLARGWAPVRARRLPLVVTLLLTAGCTGLAALMAGQLTVLVCIAGALGLNSAAAALALSLSGAVAPAGRTASLVGIQTCAGFLGAALAPVLTGVLVQGGQGFGAAFALSAGVGVVSALCFAGVRPIVVLDDEAATPRRLVKPV